MGCVTSFIYKSENYQNIQWYSELYDCRFGNIYIKKTTQRQDGYILKKVDISQQKQLLNNQAYFMSVFEKFPEFILKIQGFQQDIQKIICSKEEQKLKNKNEIYMQIEYFEKDLDDDINVKSLKSRIYESDEIWNLIYFSIFIFAQLEQKLIKIPKIERQNFLISNKKLKYFISSLYEEIGGIQNIAKEAVKTQFQSKLKEFNYVLLSTINIMNFNYSTTFSLEDLLEHGKINITEKLFDFIGDILIRNKKQFNSFQDLRNYLVFLYPTFQNLFFDPQYIQSYQN